MTNLPKKAFPIFPLLGTILLPENELPLHVFEPRYRQMVEDALAGDGWMGIVQPKEVGSFEPPLYEVGTLGHIESSEKLPDGRFLIVLKGIRKFRVRKELRKGKKLYRRVQADFLNAEALREGVDLSALSEMICRNLEQIVEKSPFQIDLKEIRSQGPDRIIQVLAQALQFRPVEKQMLLEAEGIQERGEQLLSLLQMSLAHIQDAGSGKKVVH